MRLTAPSHWHQFHTDEVLRLLDVDLKTGLAGDEVRRRQAKFGRNRITVRRGAAAWVQFLQQFNAPLAYILLVAVGVMAFLGEWVDSAVISGVVFINAIVGFLQESKAAQAIDSLSRLVLTETTVRRDGHSQRVRSASSVYSASVILLKKPKNNMLLLHCALA